MNTKHRYSFGGYIDVSAELDKDAFAQDVANAMEVLAKKYKPDNGDMYAGYDGPVNREMH
ncbi:hypothetical protein [Burkholderia ubonensis]|uniref:hypothetical protein n=1 Tax=Burkholderia ubonensis TaxID=101571 RepID=UPI0007532870|nr:hypothetical protein [Burkholderia ubonensis]KVD70138.1 hypothetical protein WI88_30855 [Burkholderia ubonensis]